MLCISMQRIMGGLSAVLVAAIAVTLVDTVSSKPHIHSNETHLFLSNVSDIQFITIGGRLTASLDELRNGTAILRAGANDLNNREVQLRRELRESITAILDIETSSTTVRNHIEACSARNKTIGANGSCKGADVRCPEITPEDGMVVTMSPPGLADLRLPGTVARINCSNGHIHTNESTLICTTQGTWHQRFPESCRPCSMITPHCTTCGHGICRSCEAPRVLRIFQNNYECVIPGTYKDLAVRDCDVLNELNQPSGIYWVKGSQPASHAVQAFCDQTTDGGGWTLLTSFQERVRSQTFGGSSAYSRSRSRMWIKGCGMVDSIGCNHEGPDYPGVRGNINEDMRSLDWRAMLNQGEHYNLRQTVGSCWSTTCSASLLNQNTEYAFVGFLDVHYSFEYPGWVLQDDSGSDSELTDLAWPLSDPRTHGDETSSYWSQPDESATMFYPPFSARNRGRTVTACRGFEDSRFNEGECGLQQYGEAGIVDTTVQHGSRDPIGVAYLPHRPSRPDACLIWGPHQDDISDIRNWCNGQPIVGLYWFRKRRQGN